MINQTVLMSGAQYFDDTYAINAHMNSQVSVDADQAVKEHAAIRKALESAGVTVKIVEPPVNCQDGVYTANWALVRGDTAVLSRLPNARQAEEPYAEKILRDLGKKVIEVPDNLRFSGQGDALPCGNYLFMGSEYRTDLAAHEFISKSLGYEVISLQTIPKRRMFGFGPRVINKQTGWPDSYYYDLDLALAVLRDPENSQKGLIAWCPEVFTRTSRQKLHQFDGVDKIEISRQEATKGLALNLVSTGETVIMSSNAPKFQEQLESLGFKIITPKVTELRKGGGFIRCTSLTLDNA
jgi:N-dimethylarginine dimethylaminohydrolase